VALIAEFQHVPGERNNRHRGVVCGWKVFQDEHGPVLQLDTYGTADRQVPWKVSQSVQLDQTAARELRQLIGQVFPELDR
jgi:hypothetical protein